MMENCINLQEIVGFKEWDERLTNRVNEWLKKVMEMQDPKIQTLNEMTGTPEGTPVTAEAIQAAATSVGDTSEDSGLPF